MNIYQELFDNYNCDIQDAQINKEVGQIVKTYLPTNLNTEVYKTCLSCVDLTSLNSTDTDTQIVKMVQKVNRLPKIFPDVPNVAAVCVYPVFAKAVRDSLNLEGVKTAAVVGGFPSSHTFEEIKVIETSMAIMEGAEEIDIVISLSNFLTENYEKVREELEEIKSVGKGANLKVILETGELNSASVIKKAAIMAISSGADFIKTSTGKTAVSATPEAVYVMCQSIKEWHEQTGVKIGIKVAGGINTAEDAATYYTIVKQVLGTAWLNNKLFRIGASRLANNLLNAIVGKETRYF